VHRLIIGYGNPLRGDDGAGFTAAERLGGLAVHQLTPDLAEPVSRADEVVFIDAAVPQTPPGPVLRRRLLAPEGGAQPFTHQCTPGSLLSLAQTLYGRAPRAILYTIAATQFDTGAPLSAGVEAAIGQLCLTLRAKDPIL